MFLLHIFSICKVGIAKDGGNAVLGQTILLVVGKRENRTLNAVSGGKYIGKGDSVKIAGVIVLWGR